jgi:twitching motility protein PilT
MLRSNAISALIRDGRTFQINEYIGTAKNKGMQLMDDCIQKNLARGDISKENAYRYALNKTNFVYSEEQKDDFVEGEETESE